MFVLELSPIFDFVEREGGGDRRGEAWTGKRKRGKGWRGGLGVAVDRFVTPSDSGFPCMSFSNSVFSVTVFVSVPRTRLASD